MKIIDPKWSVMKMYRKWGFVELIQFVIISNVYGSFCYFSFNLIKDYQEQKTGMNQFSNEVDELPLPSITICSQNVFKNVDKDLTQGFMILILKKRFGSNAVTSQEARVTTGGPCLVQFLGF